MFKNGLELLLIISIFSFSIKFACSYPAEEIKENSKENSDDSSSFGDILRSVGASIQDGAKKVGQSLQKGYEYVKKKVSEIGEDDETKVTNSTTPEAPVEQAVKSKLDLQVKPLTTDETETTTATVVLDTRFIFVTSPKCPPGEKLDHTDHCRPA